MNQSLDSKYKFPPISLLKQYEAESTQVDIDEQSPQVVSLFSVINSEEFQKSTYDLPIAMGKTTTNEIFMFDLVKAPNLLIGGTNGQEKTMALNTIITSLLYKKHPAELKFVLIDSKKEELSIYSNIEKYFLAKLPNIENPIVNNVAKTIDTLNSLILEMDNRYDLLEKANVCNVQEYNNKFVNLLMPYIVIVIDELSDLILEGGKEIELPIARIAQMAQATGIHIIIASQYPSTDIFTGTIKYNCSTRIAFKVASAIDSRIILDKIGANTLVGHGDMMFSQEDNMTCVQCAFVDTLGIKRISEYIGKQQWDSLVFELPEYYF